MEASNSVENLQQKMDNAMDHLGSIQDYFSGATIFVTGATGFLGKLLIEKLLRSCTKLERIYILMRPKKDKDCEKRFEEYFDNVVYDTLKRKCPNALKKVSMISGDCGLPDLGLNEEDRQTLISNVKCIFHIAATVRFDEKLRIATNINVRGTKDILKLARQIQNLSSFVYVSTAYSFCPQKIISEEFYESKITGEQLITLVETFDDTELDKLTPTLLGNWPNTYVFTKSVAEDVVKREGSDLPLAVVRPSIVASTAKEPVAGWIDNLYGITGVMLAAGLGFLQTMHGNPDNVADAVPADYVVNCFIAAAWEASTFKRLHFKNGETPELSKKPNNENLENNRKVVIYNYVSGQQNPLTFGYCAEFASNYVSVYASVHQFWHHCFTLHRNKYVHLFFHYLFHMIPAYILDFFARCLRKEPQLVKTYTKISKFLEVISYFATQQWVFSDKNTQQLWSKLKAEEKGEFNFDINSITWESYFHTYLPGIRVYLAKDPMDTLAQGRARAFKLKIAHYILVSVLFLGFLRLLLLLWNTVF